MRVDELGEHSHFATLEKKQEHLVDLIIRGAKEEFPEARDFYVEREENARFVANQSLVDERIF